MTIYCFWRADTCDCIYYAKHEDAIEVASTYLKNRFEDDIELPFLLEQLNDTGEVYLDDSGYVGNLVCTVDEVEVL